MGASVAWRADGTADLLQMAFGEEQLGGSVYLGLIELRTLVRVELTEHLGQKQTPSRTREKPAHAHTIEFRDGARRALHRSKAKYTLTHTHTHRFRTRLQFIST